MSLNISNPELFYAVNTALNLTLFAIFPLPTFVLCVLCIVALLFAKEVNLKMRTLLVHILSPEAIVSFSYIFNYIGYASRVYGSVDDDTSCATYGGIFMIGQIQRVIVLPFFAFAVLVFVKYEVSKLKWYVIVTYLAGYSIFSVLMGALQIYMDRTEHMNGFCVLELSLSAENLVFVSSLTVAIIAVSALGLCVVVLFSILSYCSVKKAISPNGNHSVKKAVAKVLVFHAAKSVFQLIEFGYVSLLFVPYESSDISEDVLVYYTTEITYWPFIILTPIVLLIFLKPVRDAVKMMFTLQLPCMKQTSGREVMIN